MNQWSWFKTLVVDCKIAFRSASIQPMKGTGLCGRNDWRSLRNWTSKSVVSLEDQVMISITCLRVLKRFVSRSAVSNAQERRKPESSVGLPALRVSVIQDMRCVSRLQAVVVYSSAHYSGLVV